LTLPDGDGVQVLEFIRQRDGKRNGKRNGNGATRVAILTGSVDAPSFSSGALSRADHFLLKPMTAESVLEWIAAQRLIRPKGIRSKNNRASRPSQAGSKRKKGHARRTPAARREPQRQTRQGSRRARLGSRS
jgi:hypothetical protein